jgi:hypothetical protein
MDLNLYAEKSVAGGRISSGERPAFGYWQQAGCDKIRHEFELMRYELSAILPAPFQDRVAKILGSLFVWLMHRVNPCSSRIRGEVNVVI